MRISILGGGNIGTAMAAVISGRIGDGPTVYTSKPDRWGTFILYEDINTGLTVASGNIHATDSLYKAVKDADIVFVTLPAFMRKNMIEQLSGKLKKGCTIVFVPGCGGVEYCCQKLMQSDCTIAGLDRVPCVARIVEYGRKVLVDWKTSIRLAALNKADTARTCELVSDFLDLQCLTLNNYLAVTLTPSNQIMHTVRLYNMFQYADRNTLFNYNIPFYGEWDDADSYYLFECDCELQKLCSKLNKLDLSEAISLKVHYESDTIEKMTDKIHSIKSFKKVESPMVECENGKFKIDFSSRYFQEDFPYGLCIIKSLGIICGVDMPYIDKIIRWYEGISGVDYFGDGSWNGVDLRGLNLPTNAGITTLEGVIEFYGKNNIR